MFSGSDMSLYISLVLSQLIDTLNQPNTPKTLLENTGLQFFFRCLVTYIAINRGLSYHILNTSILQSKYLKGRRYY